MAIFTIAPDETFAEIPGGRYDVITALAKGEGIKDLWLQGDVVVSELILNAATRIQGFYLQKYHLSGTSGNDNFDLTGLQDFDRSSHVIKLGAGNDTFRGGQPQSWVDGGTGNDTLYGGRFSDKLLGGEGNDVIHGGGGYDAVTGGAGGDLFVTSQRSEVSYFLEDITINDFTPGVDKIDVSGYGIASFSQLQLILSQPSGSTSFRATFNDNVYAVMLKGVHKSALSAGDFIFYTGNAREILGTKLGDRLFATNNGSILEGGLGVNELIGGIGADTFVTAERINNLQSGSEDTIRGFETGKDRIDVRSYGVSSFSQLLNILEVDNYGDASFETRFGGASHSVTLQGIAIRALDANDFVFFTGRAATVAGTQGEDTLFASAYGSTVYGKAADDTIFGSRRDDVLHGGSGADELYGANGDDVLSGDGGPDKAYGGGGDDTYIVSSKYDYTFEQANEGNDSVLSSYAGLTELFDNLENLILTGTADSKGTGNKLSNIIVGNGGDNVLKGKEGADKITGALGADDLYGGTGKDTFVFTSLKDSTVAASGRDTIFDFSQTQGDRIDLSGVDAISATSKNDAFAFIGSKGFSGKAGELRFDKKAAGTYVYGDVDGNGKADFAIELGSAIALLKGDFIL
ncbi:calcium-binding protein [Shinella sp. M31]|uniref:calcium-binding protein n=1 Tax=Shinella sp. M31 TaxID=3368615 RepID=UPI003B9DF904